MPVEVMLNTPLADALNGAIQPKLSELGWVSGGPDDSALAEYIVLMIVNGKSQEDIATELSGEFLNLGPDDPGARDFARWLFEQIEVFNAQFNGPAAAAGPEGDGAAVTSQDDTAMDGGDGGMAVDTTTDTTTELNAPTGPKSMRAGGFRGGREKRMVSQINRTLERNQQDPVLHRVSQRISRTPPTGPRMGAGRQPRTANNRAASVARGMGMGMGSGAPGMNGMNNWMMPPPPQPPPEAIMAMLEEQQRMFQMIMQQGGIPNGGPPNPNQGKSLFERVQRPHDNNFRRGGAHHHHNHQHQHQHQHGGQHPYNRHPDAGGAAAAGAEDDVEMSEGKREPPNPEETICKFNLSCTNKECKFAHQSPAAPPGTTVDVGDVCSFGAACKNRKCVGRHPSPANKMAHQGEQDCKFFPNCQNPRCPFRHPTMPLCRNGGECSTPNCKFTHIKTFCKYRPCTNRFCPFVHEEGQRGTFHDKVWVADETKEHVSERRFVDEQAPEDLIIPGTGAEVDLDTEQSGIQEVIS